MAHPKLMVEDMVTDFAIRQTIGQATMQSSIVCKVNGDELPTFVVVGTCCTEDGDFCLIVESLPRP